MRTPRCTTDVDVAHAMSCKLQRVTTCTSEGTLPVYPTTSLVFGRDPIADEMVLAIAPPSLSGYSYNNYNSLRDAPLYPTTSLGFGRDPIASEMVLPIAPLPWAAIVTIVTT